MCLGWTTGRRPSPHRLGPPTGHREHRPERERLTHPDPNPAEQMTQLVRSLTNNSTKFTRTDAKTMLLRTRPFMDSAAKALGQTSATDLFLNRQDLITGMGTIATALVRLLLPVDGLRELQDSVMNELIVLRTVRFNEALAGQMVPANTMRPVARALFEAVGAEQADVAGGIKTEAGSLAEITAKGRPTAWAMEELFQAVRASGQRSPAPPKRPAASPPGGGPSLPGKADPKRPRVEAKKPDRPQPPVVGSRPPAAGGGASSGRASGPFKSGLPDENKIREGGRLDDQRFGSYRDQLPGVCKMWAFYKDGCRYGDNTGCKRGTHSVPDGMRNALVGKSGWDDSARFAVGDSAGGPAPI